MPGEVTFVGGLQQVTAAADGDTTASTSNSATWHQKLRSSSPFGKSTQMSKEDIVAHVRHGPDVYHNTYEYAYCPTGNLSNDLSLVDHVIFLHLHRANACAASTCVPVYAGLAA